MKEFILSYSITWFDDNIQVGSISVDAIDLKVVQRDAMKFVLEAIDQECAITENIEKIKSISMTIKQA